MWNLTIRGLSVNIHEMGADLRSMRGVHWDTIVCKYILECGFSVAAFLSQNEKRTQ